MDNTDISVCSMVSKCLFKCPTTYWMEAMDGELYTVLHRLWEHNKLQICGICTYTQTSHIVKMAKYDVGGESIYHVTGNYCQVAKFKYLFSQTETAHTYHCQYWLYLSSSWDLHYLTDHLCIFWIIILPHSSSSDMFIQNHGLHASIITLAKCLHN